MGATTATALAVVAEEAMVLEEPNSVEAGDEVGGLLVLLQ